jgi:hypothetical protein
MMFVGILNHLNYTKNHNDYQDEPVFELLTEQFKNK